MSRDIRRALMIARSHYADGGETDPMLDQDQGMSIPEKPAYVMTPQPTGGVLTPSTFMERLNSELKQRASDFGQGLASFPQTAYSAMQYPMQALRGETNRAVDPNTGNVVDVSPSGMTGDEAAMVGSGLVSAGTLPDIMAGKITPNMLRAGSAADRAVELAKAPRTDLGFYSHGAETAANLPQAKGTPQQFKSMLEKNGVKPAEMEGFDEAFAGRPSVTREEIAQHFNNNMPQVEESVLGKNVLREQKVRSYETELENKYNLSPFSDLIESGALSPEEKTNLVNLYNKYSESYGSRQPTKFEKYTLPGGENYREVRLKLPDAGRPPTFDEWYEKTHINPMPEDNPRMMAMLIENYTRDMKNMPQEGNFNSSHWPNDPNVLAHIRMSDRVGPNGEKLLHVEELQSDWGQKGRKEGFKGITRDKQSVQKDIDQVINDLRDRTGNYVPTEDDWSHHPDLLKKFNEFVEERKKVPEYATIPTAPYVTSTQGWTDLALKRVMKEAAEGGYDGVVFTPGAEQAKRYNLSNHVNSIDYMKEGNDAYRLGIVNKSGEEVNLPKDTFTAKDLEEYLGKEVAKKIIDDEGKSYSGRNHKTLENLDLEVGGKGMKGYYDEIVPTQLQKLIKQYDKNAKINNKIVSLPNDFYPIEKDADLTTPWRLESRRALHGKYATKEEAINAMNSALNPQMLHVPITDKMRSSILFGQKAFKRGGEVTPYNANDALKISSRFGPVAAQDAVNVAKQLARGRP
jgi:hypothetical protein